jgi:predicted membrane-bound mannosyltransferase
VDRVRGARARHVERHHRFLFVFCFYWLLFYLLFLLSSESSTHTQLHPYFPLHSATAQRLTCGWLL